METVILCGGKGMRMKEITDQIPKPLAQINNRPILWYLFHQFSFFGHNHFILPLGYKGDVIKEYFQNYKMMNHNYTMHLQNEIIEYHEPLLEDWEITFIDTGVDTLTGGRLKKVEPYIQGDQFLLTYGDGLADIDLDELVAYHLKKGKLATVTGIKPKSSYGILKEENGIVKEFEEKPILDHIINGGFFVCNKEIFAYLTEGMLEDTLLKTLTGLGELAVYQHNGFWIGVDTVKDIEKAEVIMNGNQYFNDMLV